MPSRMFHSPAQALNLWGSFSGTSSCPPRQALLSNMLRSWCYPDPRCCHRDKVDTLRYSYRYKSRSCTRHTLSHHYNRKWSSQGCMSRCRPPSRACSPECCRRYSCSCSERSPRRRHIVCCRAAHLPGRLPRFQDINCIHRAQA